MPMTQAAASRVQSATTRANNGQVHGGSFAARAQAAAASHAPASGAMQGGGKGGN